MKSGIVGALILVLSAATSCGQHSSAVHVGPFHWNSNDSQELGGEDRISQLKSLNSVERERILDAIIQELKPNKGEVDIHTEHEWSVIAAETRIKLVDLNGDGIPEVIAQASDNELCSPTGNCSFWVFMRSGSRYELILDTDARQTFTIQKSRTNGFLDLVLGMHGSATEEGLSIYRFVNGRYQTSDCYNANWRRLVGDEWQDLKKPVITPCSR
jgi:hypothetical protein